MDRFELNWPDADASFFTDGWRCRIVWRQKGKRTSGGMGGTIDNNVQCVRRLAESLEGAPYLLSALKARGHERLAGQIESAAEQVVPARQPLRSETRTATPEAPRPVRAEKVKATPVRTASARAEQPEQTWLKALAGSAEFAVAENRRAKAWLEIGSPGSADEVLYLKTPAAKGKQEWVLKRTWPDQAKRKAEYVAAESFKGIAAYLLGAGAGAADIERLFSVAAEAGHPDLEAAATSWRSAAATH